MDNRYYIEPSPTTKSLLTLKNTISEIVSIGNLSDDDILTLRYWMDDNQHLSGNYPFDKIYSLIDNILSDGIIEEEERMQLFKILNEEQVCDASPARINSLSGKRICLTGTFSFAQKKEIEEKISAYGGINEPNSIHTYTNYLFVGGHGSTSWAYGNYGNKVKKAKEFQEKGHHIQIMGEDALKNFFDTHTPPRTYSFQECLDLFSDLPSDALKVIQKHILSALNCPDEIIIHRSQPVLDLLMDRDILWECTDYDYSNILHHLSRNELNERIESLNLNISFNKKMRLVSLINWCIKNIPAHIKELLPDYTVLSLNENFLDSDLLKQLLSHFDTLFPLETSDITVPSIIVDRIDQ